MDNNFPYIKYDEKKSWYDNGVAHGEEFRAGIKDLLEIRKSLMLARNPDLVSELDELAMEQWHISEKFAPEIMSELDGIAKGSDLSRTDIVIVNNYTDFRDIEGHDQGCSTIYGQKNQSSFAGQTWDMHSSAKKYVSLIHSPAKDGFAENITFSLIGCVGMAGINNYGQFIGVNNINTLGAKPGVIWPVLVRKVLQQKNYKDMQNVLTKSAPTSGHSYILGSKEEGSIWEIGPNVVERTGHVEQGSNKEIFHTNHCLGEETKKIEFQTGVNSTTHDRYKILEDLLPKVQNGHDLEKLLKDHTNFPKSICSHFESGSQDPSVTCGGVNVDYDKKEILFWRGCEEHDDNYKAVKFSLNDNKLIKE